MAIAMQVGDILAVRAWSTLNEQAAVNTYNYQCIAVTGGACTDQDLADSLGTSMGTFYKGLMPGSVGFNGVQVYYLRHAGLLSNPVKNLAGAGPGTKGTTPVPRNTCGILKYNTNERGPGGRGRLFLPFVSVDWLTTDAEPDGAYAVYVNSWASALLAVVTLTNGGSTATLVWSLARKVTGSPVTATSIVAAESAQKFGQQHKRGDYGRANESPI